jgi:hypothetical protein
MGAQVKTCATGGVTESATENRPPAERSTVASRRETCGTSSKRAGLKPGLYMESWAKARLYRLARLARVKRWGKSPPLRWRQRRHGKPRAVQGQIGGESWPGSMSERS